jgi:hypothetical protein
VARPFPFKDAPCFVRFCKRTFPWSSIASRYAADTWARDECHGRCGEIVSVYKSDHSLHGLCDVRWDREDGRSWGPGRSHEVALKYTGSYRCGAKGCYHLSLAPDQHSVDREAIVPNPPRQRSKTVQASTDPPLLDWMYMTPSDGTDGIANIASALQGRVHGGVSDWALEEEAGRIEQRQKELSDNVKILGEKVREQIEQIMDMCESCLDEANSAMKETTSFPEAEKKQDDEPVSLQWALDLDHFQEVNNPENLDAFKKDMAVDLANALGLPKGKSDRFEIKNLESGSIKMQIDIMPDNTAGATRAKELAEELKKQAADPFSKLRSGKYTAHTQSVGLGNLEETFFEQLEEKKVGEEVKRIWALITDTEVKYKEKVDADQALAKAMSELNQFTEPSHMIFCAMKVPDMIRKLEKIHGAGMELPGGQAANMKGGYYGQTGIFGRDTPAGPQDPAKKTQHIGHGSWATPLQMLQGENLDEVRTELKKVIDRLHNSKYRSPTVDGKQSVDTASHPHLMDGRRPTLFTDLIENDSAAAQEIIDSLTDLEGNDTLSASAKADVAEVKKVFTDALPDFKELAKWEEDNKNPAPVYIHLFVLARLHAPFLNF